MIAIKWYTLIKGIVWELTGIVGLILVLWVTTGSVATACNIGITWPLGRVFMWLPFDALWKKYARSIAGKITTISTNEGVNSVDSSQVQETK